jgi:hypothetical protein
MHMSEQSRNRWLSGFVEGVDRLLLPIAAGCLTFTLLVQGMGRVPAVRQYLDTVEGRFIQMPKEVVPASVSQEQASITLYLSPVASADTEIQVLRNGRSIGAFHGSKLSITLREGDQISLYAPNLQHQLVITVDHNDPRLLTPAPGWTAVLTPTQPRAQLPSAKFTM